MENLKLDDNVTSLYNLERNESCNCGKAERIIKQWG
jgi:hypothetical protein